MKKNVIVVLFSLLSSLSISQRNTIAFKNLTIDDGLSSNQINCIFEDQVGFMWFGTQNGLNQFDGYNVNVYNTEQGNSNTLCNNSVYCLIEEKETSNLWIGTDLGLDYYVRKYDYFIDQISEYKGGDDLENKSIRSLCYDYKGNLWIGTYANGVYRLNTDKSVSKYKYSEEKVGGISHNSILAIHQDELNNIWFGTDEGLDLYDYSTNTFHHHKLTPNLKAVQCIYSDLSNNLWIGTYINGLFLMEHDGFDKRMKRYSKANGYLVNDCVSSIIEDESEKFYIIDRDGGLIYFDKAKDTSIIYVPDIYTPNGISSKSLLSIFKSKSRIIWIGSIYKGVIYIDKNRKQFEHYQINFREDGLFNNNVRAIFQDGNGEIWIGTKEGGGLSKFNRQLGTFIHYKPDFDDPNRLNSDYIISISEINNHKLLVATLNKGLNILDKQKNVFTHKVHNEDDIHSIHSNSLYSVHKTIGGAILIGTYASLDRYYPQKDIFEHNTHIGSAKCFCDEDINNVWIGTLRTGLYLYNIDSKEYVHYTQKSNDTSSLGSNKITALHKDKKKRLWIATDGGGLNLLIDKKGIFRRFTTKNILPSNNIFNLLIDGHDNLWLNTAKGLFKFRTDSFTIKEIALIEDEPIERYNALKTRNGEMIFGGGDGFYIFHPDSIKDNPYKPPVVITGLKLFNKPVEINTDGSPLKQHILCSKNLILNHKHL